MNAVLWALAAVALWFLVSTIECGGLACAPYIAFFYVKWWFPVVCYAAVSELFITARWPRLSPILCLAFATVSFASLVVYLWLGPAPFLFSDPERAMTFRGLVLLPAACIGALYVAKASGSGSARLTHLKHDRPIF
jgi:hypothetical protein